MNKVRKIKIDLFRSDKHKELFELMKPNLNDKQQHEAVSRLMFMTSSEVLTVINKVQKDKNYGRIKDGPIYF